ncbi:hypothetical protein SD10_15965 [Spirosoma radiotolerans]|uniref:Uncharacterized protein n=1 Tax=Spirosoma radiotolerans TaxID=1379870 RepID=A0A0E3ZX72_9BACT|nr:hypothetical protein SD10_15965 [Spirosoma radiotolerans]
MLLLWPAVKAQPVAFEGANTIVITTDLADKEAYLTISQVLTEQNMPIEVASTCLRIRVPLKSVQYSTSAEPILIGQLSVHAGLVKLTGIVQEAPSGRNNTGLASSKVIPASYQKERSKSTLPRLGFLYLSDLAKKLHPALHGVISYKVQPEPMD